MAQSPTMERVTEALESQLHAIKGNLQQVLRRLLWSLVLEVGRTGKHGGGLGIDIDTVVNGVVNTSRYDADGCPIWGGPVEATALANLRAALAEKGIK